MKAFLLAAGPGTRLRPLTDATPKCLLPLNGRPLLAHWLDELAARGVLEVLVNTHHLAEQVARFVAQRTAGPAVTLAHEPHLLGTAGALRGNRRFVAGERHFFVGYADTWMRADLSALLSAHHRAAAVATLGLFHAPAPRECGIATLDAGGVIVDFEEKPARSDLAFAGVLVGSGALLDAIPEPPCDLGRDVFPRLKGRLAGYTLAGPVCDIGTPAGYDRAQAGAPGAR